MTEFNPAQLRVLGLSAPTIITMLKDREVMILQKIYGEYKAGKTDFLSMVAEYACIRDMHRDITRALDKLNQGED